MRGDALDFARRHAALVAKDELLVLPIPVALAKALLVLLAEHAHAGENRRCGNCFMLRKPCAVVEDAARELGWGKPARRD